MKPQDPKSNDTQINQMVDDYLTRQKWQQTNNQEWKKKSQQNNDRSKI